jgi:hypothetical protein
MEILNSVPAYEKLFAEVFPDITKTNISTPLSGEKKHNILGMILNGVAIIGGAIVVYKILDHYGVFKKQNEQPS